MYDSNTLLADVTAVLLAHGGTYSDREGIYRISQSGPTYQPAGSSLVAKVDISDYDVDNDCGGVPALFDIIKTVTREEVGSDLYADASRCFSNLYDTLRNDAVVYDDLLKGAPGSYKAIPEKSGTRLVVSALQNDYGMYQCFWLLSPDVRFGAVFHKARLFMYSTIGADLNRIMKFCGIQKSANDPLMSYLQRNGFDTVQSAVDEILRLLSVTSGESAVNKLLETVKYDLS